MRKLGARLDKILELIPKDSVFADIGCDHGKLAVSAVLDGKVSFAYCSDLSENCLAKAKELATECGTVGKMDFFVGDGLEQIPADAETFVIAGMGGMEIISILSNADNRAGRYILSPHKNLDKVVEYLTESGYTLLEQHTVKEKNHIYNILVCDK